MWIIGNGENLNRLKLKLESTNMGFECVVNPDPYESLGIIVEEKPYALITFKDSSEIDSLIMMLENFKKENIRRCIGVWK